MAEIIALKTGEFFAGAGGLGLGFLLAGHSEINYRPMFTVDMDQSCLDTYEYNLKWLSENAPHLLARCPKMIKRSIDNISPLALHSLGVRYRSLDLLLGGPPCQGYSPSNRKSKKQKRSRQNNLVKTFL